MALCKLTSSFDGRAPIYVNPLQVVAVEKIAEETCVFTTALNGNGSSRFYSVSESIEETVALLDGAMPRFA